MIVNLKQKMSLGKNDTRVLQYRMRKICVMINRSRTLVAVSHREHRWSNVRSFLWLTFAILTLPHYWQNLKSKKSQRRKILSVQTLLLADIEVLIVGHIFHDDGARFRQISFLHLSSQFRSSLSWTK